MIVNKSQHYSHNLADNAAQLLIQFHDRILIALNVEPSFEAFEYIPYTFPESWLPFVYADRRILDFRVLIDTPFSAITPDVDAQGLCKPCVAFPKFNAGKAQNNRVMIYCTSPRRIEYIINVINKLR